MQLTQKQLESKKKELEEIYKRMKDLKRQLSGAASYGGAFPTKIPEYASTEEEMEVLDNLALRIENEIENVEIVDLEKMDCDTVSVLSIISAKNLLNDSLEKYCFGKTDDQNIFSISQGSPIGEAIIGKKIGDIIECDIPMGKKKLKVVEIKIRNA